MIQPTLAQAGMGSGLSALILAGVVIGALVLGFAGLMLVRRKIMAAPTASEPPVGGLEHLRLLRQRGQISEDEFQEARARLIKRVTAKTLTPKQAGQPSPRFSPGASAAQTIRTPPFPSSLAPNSSTPPLGPNPSYPNIPSTDAAGRPTE